MNTKLTIECPSCQGTGLYKGMAERDEAAVVCSGCQGKGWQLYWYNEFTGLKVRQGVSRVFLKTCGYIHSHKDTVTSEGRSIEFSKGGCSYQEWLSGKVPLPVKELYCPYLWDNRGMGNEPCSRCVDGLGSFGSIGNCKYFNDKAKCWQEDNNVLQ